jgi:hypothetical protein
VTALTVSTDGTRLATLEETGRVTIWDARGRLRGRLCRDRAAFERKPFHLHGRMLLHRFRDGRIRVTALEGVHLGWMMDRRITRDFTGAERVTYAGLLR